MNAHSWLAAVLSLVAGAVLVLPATAFEADATFTKGTYVLSGEGSYGAQWHLEEKRDQSDIRFWNLGVRVSLLPFGAAGPSILHGAFEIGLEPLYQRYIEPSAFWAGVLLVLRYHFVSLGRFVPYVELAAGPGATDLNVREITSNFSFLVWGGVGASVFLTDTTAVYAGWRYEHNSNGNTAQPNRGFESSVGVFGVSYYLR